MKNLFCNSWLPLLIVSISLVSMKFKTDTIAADNDDGITLCSSSPGIITPGADGKFIAALPGWGTLQYRISTKNDSAQFYFNQGLNFYYGYHFTESLASFKEAGRFDSSNAMIYWGQALAMGPFYNTYVYKMRHEVPETIEAMKKYRATALDNEQALIETMTYRYSGDFTNSDRKQLNRTYAQALATAMQKAPDNNNLKALYIDAVMLEHKWDFWDQHGEAKPWTQELITLCEEGLKRDGNHPAFLHYYIHLVEASRDPQRALAAADVLKNNLPGIAHMVHMSSHMYQRNGLYIKGVDVNDEASAVNNRVDSKAPQLNIGKNKSIHFYAVQSYCAMTAAMDSKGTRIYERARERQLAMSTAFEKDPYAQFVYMIPVIANVRLGKWDVVLKSAKPSTEWTYALAIDNFARGLSHLHNKNIADAKKCLTSLNETLSDSLLGVRLMPFNSPVQSCRIASAILRGQILYHERKLDDCIAALSDAVAEEDNMIYREPHDWMIPARQYLGTYLLKMNRPAEAAQVFKEDLVANPGNGWSLVGMQRCMEAQKKKKEAADYKRKAAQAFQAADVQPEAAIY